MVLGVRVVHVSSTESHQIQNVLFGVLALDAFDFHTARESVRLLLGVLESEWLFQVENLADSGNQLVILFLLHDS